MISEIITPLAKSRCHFTVCVMQPAQHGQCRVMASRNVVVMQKKNRVSVELKRSIRGLNAALYMSKWHAPLSSDNLRKLLVSVDLTSNRPDISVQEQLRQTLLPSQEEYIFVYMYKERERERESAQAPRYRSDHQHSSIVRQMNSWMHFLYCCSVGLLLWY